MATLLVATAVIVSIPSRLLICWIAKPGSGKGIWDKRTTSKHDLEKMVSSPFFTDQGYNPSTQGAGSTKARKTQNKLRLELVTTACRLGQVVVSQRSRVFSDCLASWRCPWAPVAAVCGCAHQPHLPQVFR